MERARKKQKISKKAATNKDVEKKVKAAPVPKKEVVETEAEAEAEVEAGPAAAEADEAVEATNEGNEEELPKTFKELGLVDVLCEICATKLGYASPTPIQAKSIPVALQKRDLIGTAETGSGKTIAFLLPMLQGLLEKPRPLYGLVLSPTRELALQIMKAAEAFSDISLRCAALVGGMDMVSQQIALGKRPHVIVATPGRLLEHLQKTKGFALKYLKFLVFDEADRLLDSDFGLAIEKILNHLPRERLTMLFSATMSSQVESLQRACLRDPVRVSVSSGSHQTVSKLKQSFLLTPQTRKDVCLIYLIDQFHGQSTIVFTRTRYETQRVAILLRSLGFPAIPIHGDLSQTARLSALNKIRAGTRDILVATDVAARGIDIPHIGIVVNYDMPQDSNTYVHRVGRTARAGKSGHAITMVTQYDHSHFLAIESAIGMAKKISPYHVEKEDVLAFKPRVEEAQRYAQTEMRRLGEMAEKHKGKGRSSGKSRHHDNKDREEL